MSNLYEITGELLALQELLEDSVDDQVLVDTLEAVQGEYEVKMEAYCKIIRNLEADITAVKSELDRLSLKRKVLENNVDRLKKSMFDSLKTTGTDKIKGTLFTIAIQRNGGKTPVVSDPNVDLSKLPDNMVVVTEKPNLDAIREALEKGVTVDGFKLGERGESLRIK